MPFYDLGPWWKPDECLPSDCWRVQVEMQDGRITVAVCLQGKWWSAETRDEVPVRWRHMLDHRMTV